MRLEFRHTCPDVLWCLSLDGPAFSTLTWHALMSLPPVPEPSGRGGWWRLVCALWLHVGRSHARASGKAAEEVRADTWRAARRTGWGQTLAAAPRDSPLCAQPVQSEAASGQDGWQRGPVAPAPTVVTVLHGCRSLLQHRGDLCQSGRERRAPALPADRRGRARGPAAPGHAGSVRSPCGVCAGRGACTVAAAKYASFLVALCRDA